MAPNNQTSQEFLESRLLQGDKSKEKNPATSEQKFKPEYVWGNIILFAILHIGGFLGVWQFLTFQVKWQTLAFTYIVGWLTVESTMVGVHRFYTHKAFKGTFSFKLAVMIVHTIAGQNSIYVWARDHRLHHKYSDTDADPHNSQRGFWFSHMTWLVQKKHPLVKLKGQDIDMSDLKSDPIVTFQRKYYFPLFLFLGFGFPILTPVIFWSESLKNAVLVSFFARYMITLHGTWTVNSFAHLYGNRPYSKDIQPVESEFVAWLTSGEGWHNYHHTFPWDYRAGEFGKKWNLSSTLVDWLASVGLVYDLKFATAQMIQHRVMKRGDGSHPTASALKDEHADTIDGKMFNNNNNNNNEGTTPTHRF